MKGEREGRREGGREGRKGGKEGEKERRKEERKEGPPFSCDIEDAQTPAASAECPHCDHDKNKKFMLVAQSVIPATREA
jgi:hypothetical protein